MKKILSIISVLVVSICFSQDFKVKRGEIFVEGKTVAKIGVSDNKYIISDVNNRPVFSVKFIDKAVLDSVRDSYMELNRVYNAAKTIELDYESPSFFSGNEKTIAHTSIKTYGIINEKGINIQKLDELYKTIPKRKLENKLKEAYTLRNKFNKMQLSINNVGEILSHGNRVGYFNNLPVSFGPNNTINEKMFNDIEIYDAENKLVGRYTTTTKQIKTTNGKSFTLYKGAAGTIPSLKNPTYQNLVERIIVMDPKFIKAS